MNRTHTSLAATGVAVIAAALTLARAWGESEHDPWPPDCPRCGLFAPSHFGPVVARWMNEHNCEGETP